MYMYNENQMCVRAKWPIRPLDDAESMLKTCHMWLTEKKKNLHSTNLI